MSVSYVARQAGVAPTKLQFVMAVTATWTVSAYTFIVRAHVGFTITFTPNTRKSPPAWMMCHMTTKMDSKVLCAALLSIAILGISAVASFAADPTGTWRTQENATVRVSSCGGGLCATIASIKEPNDPQTGKPKTDIRNVDPSKRNRPIVGLQIFIGLRPEGANKWTGRIYSPEDGKAYDVNVVLENAGTLRIQGCVFGVCESAVWRRQG